MSDDITTVNNGRFTAGNRRRPVGSRNKTTALAEAINAHNPDALQAIVGKVTDAAVKGEKWAIQIVMDKLFASPKDRVVTSDLPPVRTPEDIPAALDAVLQAASRGELSPSEASSLCATIVDGNGKIMDDVHVYLDTVRKIAAAKGDNKQAVMALQPPYPVPAEPADAD